MNKESILDIRVDTRGLSDLLTELEERISAGIPSSFAAINPEKILNAKEDPELAHLLNTFDYQIPDGIGIVLASKLNKGKIRERITGIDLMDQLCHFAEQRGLSVFVFGSKKEILTRALSNLQIKYPKLIITGSHDGYSARDTLIQEINSSGADIVFVALGSPAQEFWIAENKELLKAKVFQGVGGSLDVLSGSLKRAPLLMQRMGLEWLYRLIQEPWRIKRQLALLGFFKLVLNENKK